MGSHMNICSVPVAANQVEGVRVGWQRRPPTWLGNAQCTLLVQLQMFHGYAVIHMERHQTFRGTFSAMKTFELTRNCLYTYGVA